MKVRPMLSLLLLVSLAAAACARVEDTATPDAGTASEPAAGERSTVTPEQTPTPEPTVELPDYAAQVGGLPRAADDRSLPEVEPDGPVGAYGFSRYVYQRQGEEIVPTLIEGPQGFQTRCQDIDKECSYVELVAIHERGGEIPEYLNMDRETLAELVDQLGRVEAAVAQYETLDDACAAGMFVSSAQNPNMGIHVIDAGAGSEFNPDRPQMILFAKPGGELIPRHEIGQCVDGEFTGEPGFAPVGAVFNIALSETHPDGFAGDLDNWHIHLNTCGNSARENAQVLNPEVEMATSASREECEANGGQFLDIVPTWMMHAYVAPEHDPQGGIFSMWNPNLWPLVNDVDEIREFRTPRTADAVAAPIVNFDFGDELQIDAGEVIRFANADSVPHTVTAGSFLSPDPGAFDSGLLGTGDAFEVRFADAGQYELFCALHPDMTATVTVAD